MDLFVLSASLGLDTTKFEGGISTARRLLTQFGRDVINFGQDTIETGMGFDKQMSAVQAVMGLTEDTEENMKTMSALRKYALQQARDSIFTSEETAQAYYYMGMAGWNAEQMTAGLPGVMALAAASGEDLKLTSDMVTDSLTAFGLGAGQASHFADVLAVTATNSNTDVARMQQTFKNLAPIAGSLGYSIDDVAVSVGLLANSGIKGSQAGTALRNIFTRIATNAGATKTQLGALEIVTDKLGVSFYDAEGRARPWGEVLADMRESWRQLDPSEVDVVTAAFGDFFVESQSAEEIMSDFANDLDTWTTEWNSLTTAVERENFVAELEPMFTALGISMRDSNGNLREFSAVAQDARVKLGGLTDEEQIYYGKQIGSLRGISGWLALMTASEEDVNHLTEAVHNADGAAQAMADTRLDNLWGDIVRFNSALDVMKVAIYDDIKGPLRDVVQGGVASINRITDAIEKGGLIGGIEQLGVEIETTGKTITPILESIGKAVAPVISSIITEIVPSLAPVILELGISLGKGIIQGISDSPTVQGLISVMATTGIGKQILDILNSGGGSNASGIASQVTTPIVSGVIAFVSGIFGNITKFAGRFIPGIGASVSNASKWLITGASTLIPEIAAASAPALIGVGMGALGGAALDYFATERDFGDYNRMIGNADNIIADAQASNEYVQKLGELFASIRPENDDWNLDSSVKAWEFINSHMSELEGVLGDLSQYGWDYDWVEDNIGTNVIDVGSAAGRIMTELANQIETGINDGGNKGAAGMEESLNASGDRSAGHIATTIQSGLNGLTLPDFSVRLYPRSHVVVPHASAMSNGEILRGMTPFGLDRSGNIHYGGEVGAEAVVGVNSLDNMIQKSVKNAFSGFKNPVENQRITVQLILDSGELLAAVDVGLNDRANWRGGGRA